jgi:exonuclease SbcD
MEPGTARALLDDSSIHSHEAAMKAIVGKIEETIDPNEPNVLIGHAFVLGGKTTDSERTLSVGGSGCVSKECFAPFSYTALGHLHSPDAIKDERIRYAGSLLKYSFSEAKQNKSISIVDIDEKGRVEIETRSLQPQKDLREIEGYLDELLDPAFYGRQKVDDYLKVTLLDEGAMIDPMNKLRQVYPNVLHLEKKREQQDLKERQYFQAIQQQEKNELDMFKAFYQKMTSLPFTKEKEMQMASLIDEVKRGQM